MADAILHSYQNNGSEQRSRSFKGVLTHGPSSIFPYKTRNIPRSRRDKRFSIVTSSQSTKYSLKSFSSTQY